MLKNTSNASAAPFDFETLATYTYQFAKDEMLEAAFPALMIVISGLLPVILMNHMLRRTD